LFAPLVVAGAVKFVDGEGKPLPNAPSPAPPAVALCRCGQSKNKPFCDGSHKAANFQG
jgi:CDGSH-type Zn-finger protein